MLPTERNDGDPAKGEPLPAANAVGTPVAAVVALRGHVLVALEAACEVFFVAVTVSVWSFVAAWRGCEGRAQWHTFCSDDEEEGHYLSGRLCAGVGIGGCGDGGYQRCLKA
jgi:hypothetical protein